MITGAVKTLDGTPLPNVQVSNGLDVTGTDPGGRYALPDRPNQRFVFLTVPAGYVPADRFYIELQSQTSHDFTLTPPPPGATTDFPFVQITDLHLSPERRYLPADLAQDLAQIRREVGDQIHFIVASGDLTAGGKREEYEAYLQTLAGWSCYHAAGNHDDDADVQGQHYMDHLGPLYYSFDYGPVHFAVYDGEAHLRDGTEATPFAYVPTAQDTWLRADLAAQDPSRPVIIINHFPWGDEFYAQWRDFPVVASLSGHWHSTRRCADGDAIHYNTPSLGFGGIDQSPRAYRLCTWADGQLHSELRALVPQGLFPGISFRPDNTADPVRHRAQDPTASLQLRWRTGTGGAIHKAPPLVADGCVFQAIKNEDQAAGNGLVALDAHDGTWQWTHATNDAIKNAPAHADGRLYTATVTGQIIALDAATGGRLWSRPLDYPTRRWVYSSPLIHAGRVYAGMSSHMVALDPLSGAEIWRRADFGPDDWLPSYPSPAARGDYLAVAFYTQPTSLAVLAAATGATVWRQRGDKPNYIYSTPVIGPHDTLYATSGGDLRAYHLTTGELLWQSPIALQRVQNRPALADGRLFVATGSGALCAFSAQDGAELWRWEVETKAPLFTPYARQGPTTLSAPTVASGRVYIAGADGYLYVLDAATGACIDQCDLGVPLAAQPTVDENQLWVGGSDGSVYALAIGN